MSDPDPDMTVAVAPIDESLLSYTHVMYALHSLAVLIGVTTFHTIVGSFIGSLSSIVAVVMNYARRSATHGTFIESHFRSPLRHSPPPNPSPPQRRRRPLHRRRPSRATRATTPRRRGSARPGGVVSARCAPGP